MIDLFIVQPFHRVVEEAHSLTVSSIGCRSSVGCRVVQRRSLLQHDHRLVPVLLHAKFWIAFALGGVSTHRVLERDGARRS